MVGSLIIISLQNYCWMCFSVSNGYDCDKKLGGFLFWATLYRGIDENDWTRRYLCQNVREINRQCYAHIENIDCTAVSVKALQLYMQCVWTFECFEPSWIFMNRRMWRTEIAVIHIVAARYRGRGVYPYRNLFGGSYHSTLKRQLPLHWTP